MRVPTLREIPFREVRVGMRAGLLSIIVIALLSGSTCSLPWEDREPSGFTIVSYNVHNLFDDVEDGSEYPEFSLESGKWNSGLYQKRLIATAAAISSFFPEGGGSPDIICLQELESEKVLKDLASGPLKKEGYMWIALGGPEASAVKCGILSRHPFKTVRAHSLVDAWGFGSGRDILEATFELGSEGFHLTVFVCHWKSRREGEAETETARRGASGLVAARLAELAAADPESCILVCGDFNESPDEFARAGRLYPTALMPDPRDLADGNATPGKEIPAAWFEGVLRVTGIPAHSSMSGKEVTLYSPWFGAEGFSYIFDGERERLDGFLLSPALVDGQGLEYSRFSASADPSLLDGNGKPLAWIGSSGFSDHLPIALTISK